MSDISIEPLVTALGKVEELIWHLYDHQDVKGSRVVESNWSLWEQRFKSDRFD